MSRCMAPMARWSQQSNNFGEGVAEHIVTVVQSAGRYYVRVTPFSRRDAGQPYDLTVNFF